MFLSLVLTFILLIVIVCVVARLFPNIVINIFAIIGLFFTICAIIRIIFF